MVKKVTLKVACSRNVISPPPDIELGGYGFYRNRKNKGVHDDLYVRSLLITDGNEEVIIINADLLDVSDRVEASVKELVSEKLGIKKENIIITVTHTHYAPPTTFFRGCGEVDENFVEDLITKMANSVVNLEKRVKEAKMRYSEIKVEDVAFNRVTKDEPLDPYARIIQFKDLSGNVIATLFNYSCHPVCIDVRTDAGFYVSADWPGVTMKVIDSKIGGITFFLQGTCGDIDPVVAWKMRGFDAAQEIGEKVAKYLLQALDKSTYISSEPLKIVSKRVKLPLQKFTHEDLVRVIAVYLKRLEKMKMNIKMDLSNVIKLIRFYRECMEDLADKISKGLPSYIETTFYALRIGEIAILFIPGEVFTEIGIRIREKSPFEKLLIVGYTGAYLGYIPTPDEFDRYGYAAYMVPLMIGKPPYERNIANVYVEESIQLLRKLTQ